MAGEISARFHRRGAADQSRPLPAGSPGDADRVADQTKASELSRELLCISAAEAGAGAVAAALLRATAGGHREAEGIRAPLRRRTTGARSQGPRKTPQSPAQKRRDDRCGHGDEEDSPLDRD